MTLKVGAGQADISPRDAVALYGYPTLSVFQRESMILCWRRLSLSGTVTQLFFLLHSTC